jgi:hypothetical protein
MEVKVTDKDDEYLEEADFEDENLDDDEDGSLPAEDRSAPDGEVPERGLEGRPPDLPAAAPPLQELLAGAVPTFLVHKGAQRHSRLAGLTQVAQASVGSRAGIGIAIRLPRHTPDKAAEFLSQFSGVDLRIADPEVFTHDAQLRGHTVAAQNYEYMRVPIPESPSNEYIDACFQAQEAAGATVLLSPTGWLDEANAGDQLVNLAAWVAASRERAGSKPMFVNVNMSRRWVEDQGLRARLLNEMVESEERLWWVRARWGILSPRYGQLTDVPVLNGYRELCSVSSAEGKVIFLPNTGLTGWLCTALGAAGFSAGIGRAEQAFAEEQRFGRQPGQQTPPRRARYFERSMLHTVDWAVHGALSQVDGYQQCMCRYCDTLMSMGGTGQDWDFELAGLHYLLRCALLQGMLGVRNPRNVAGAEVRRASEFFGGLTDLAAVTGESVPRHLQVWDRLLQ